MLALSPHGRLLLTDGKADPELARAFQTGAGAGLLYLDQATTAVTEDPVFAEFRDCEVNGAKRLCVRVEQGLPVTTGQEGAVHAVVRGH
jgi:hypothetical protein